MALHSPGGLHETDSVDVKAARDALTAGNVREMHAELGSIRGVGPKIASFFLRDVAIRDQIAPASCRGRCRGGRRRG